MPVACAENTAKLTPPGVAEGPMGSAEPAAASMDGALAPAGAGAPSGGGLTTELPTQRHVVEASVS